MSHRITLIAGNTGQSTHMVDVVCDVVDALGLGIAWERHFFVDSAPTEAMLQSIRETGVGLMPFMKGRREEGIPAPIVQLRRSLGVFANVRPIRSIPALNERFDDVELLVVRETTEDIYASLEHESIPGTFESLKVTTRSACERIARYAFETAKRLGRERVTTVHKSNIMKKSDGLFLAVAREVAADFPEIVHDERIVDALCMQLVMYPSRFDVLLCGNLFGDIVSDLAAGLVGGKDNCPSVNIAPHGVRVFTAGHGRDERVQNSPHGNPMGLLLTAARMLRDIGEESAAAALDSTVRETLDAGHRPVVLGGDQTLTDFANAVRSRLP